MEFNVSPAIRFSSLVCRVSDLDYYSCDIMVLVINSFTLRVHRVRTLNRVTEAELRLFRGS